MRKSKGLIVSALFGLSLIGAAISVQAATAPTHGRFVVAFKAGQLTAARAAIKAAGGRELLDLSEGNALAVDLPLKAVAALRANGQIAWVEQDVERHMMTDLVTPSGPPYATGQLVPYGIKMVQADQLPVLDNLASDRTICIIDSGYDISHEDLNGNRVTGENLTTSGDWNTDEAHHGTHVAGTISAMNNTGIGVVGINPNEQLNIRIEKVFDASGSAPSSTIAKAMFRCGMNHANVVTMSLGGSSSSKIEQVAATWLAKRNTLIVAAAGNAGTSDVSYPAGFAEVVSVAAIDVNKAHASFSQFNDDVELAAPGVSVYSTVPMGTGSASSLTVGNTSYSTNGLTGSPNATATAPLYNYGTGEVSDPGVAGKICVIQRGNISFADKVTHCQTDGGVGAVIYNNAPGNFNGTLNGAVTSIPSVSVSDTDGAALIAAVGQTATVAVMPSNYAYYDGTSMATPHVSGVAALVWSYFPHCTATQIRNVLDATAQDLGDAGRDVYYGYGLVQAKAAYDWLKANGCGAN
jgi:subtilisin family serine protease